MSRMKTLLPTTIRTKTYQDYSVVKTNLKAENQRQKYYYHKTSCLSLTCPANCMDELSEFEQTKDETLPE